MGLVRIVIQKPEGTPYSGLGVGLDRTEPEFSDEGQDTTDEAGVARFWVEPGTFKVRLEELPSGTRPPKYGTTVRLQEFAEGIEYVIRLSGES